MSITFDEWWRVFSGENRLPENTFIKLAYEAGVQSRYKEVLKLQCEVDELQNRVDKTVEYIECYYGVVELSMIIDMLEGK